MTFARQFEVIHVLLERGANVGAEDLQGETPFSLAKKYGYDEIMRLLSKYGGPVRPHDLYIYLYLSEEI